MHPSKVIHASILDIQNMTKYIVFTSVIRVEYKWCTWRKINIVAICCCTKV